MTRILGLLIGIAIAAAAIIWALLIRDRPEREAPPPIIRPLLVAIAGAEEHGQRRFPARVRATAEATLSFVVAGTVQELPITRGQRVKRGDLLAQLDLRDFESRLASSEANLKQRREELERRQRAFDQGAATEMEMVRARVALDSSLADRDIAQKALEDATLRAPFDGLLSDVFVDQFQKVAPGTRVARLQGGDGMRVEINVDAGRVALARTMNERVRHAVRFDFLPEREFEAKLVEFTTEADATTQTFRAFFQIEPPTDVVILPGMTATVIERATDAISAAPGVTVPLDSVVFDGAGGQPFVWTVGDDGGRGTAAVSRTPVTVAEVGPDQVRIVSGLAAGTRIAAAGVHHLTNGQIVRPVSSISPESVK